MRCSPPLPRSESPPARSIAGRPCRRGFQEIVPTFQDRASRSGDAIPRIVGRNFEASDSIPFPNTFSHVFELRSAAGLRKVLWVGGEIADCITLSILQANP